MSAPSQQATPLYISPLCHYGHPKLGNDPHDDTVGHYQVLHRQITPPPLQRRRKISCTNDFAEIETRLEQFVDKKDGTVLWRRVVVSSGPCSTACASTPVESSIHASFLLPDDAFTKEISSPAGFYSNPNLVCWTSFPDSPDHYVLCVLAHPALLCIWDVYPLSVKMEDDNRHQNNEKNQHISASRQQSTNAPHSGFSSTSVGQRQSYYIPLPFEACGIHDVTCVNGMGGLLVQRCETAEDLFAYEERTRENVSASAMDHSHPDRDVTDAGFVLKPPPKPVRVGGRDPEGTSSSCVGVMGTTKVNFGEIESSGVIFSSPSVPSLFSLSHPLGDVLPVACSESNLKDDAAENATSAHEHNGLALDVFEKVLFVGTAEWLNTRTNSFVDRRMESQVICVTYHSHLKRHAIWEINQARAPPPPEPLWKLCRQWRSGNQTWDGHLGILQQDMEDMVLMDGPGGNVPRTKGSASAVDSSRYESRADALADALGVSQRRTTPRNSAVGIIDNANRRVSRSGQGASSGNKNATSKTAALDHSLLSPMSRVTAALDSSETKSVSSAANDVAGVVENSLMTKFSSFAKLQPKMSTTRIYCDPTSTKLAENVFLASNSSGSGTLTLCMLCPATQIEKVIQSEPKELKLFSLVRESDSDADAVHQRECQVSVLYDGSIPCATAQPICAMPTPKTFDRHRCSKLNTWTGMAKDILILKRKERRKASLCLFRHLYSIADFAVGGSDDNEELFEIIDLNHGVGNAIDIHCRDYTHRHVIVIRGRLSMVLESSMMGEKLMQASDVALEKAGLIDVALKMRANCAKMESEASKSLRLDMTSDAECNDAVRTIILSLFGKELLSSNANSFHDMKDICFTSSGECNHWNQMLDADCAMPPDDCRDFLSTSLDYAFGKSTTACTEAKPGSSNQSFLSVEWVESLDVAITEVLFDALHLFYEDTRLCSSMREYGVGWIGCILSRVCAMALHNPAIPTEVPRNYLSHYANELQSSPIGHMDMGEVGVVESSKNDSSRPLCLTSLFPPPCIFTWIQGCLAGDSLSHPYAGKAGAIEANAACDKSHTILRIFSLLFDKRDLPGRLQDSDFGVAKLLSRERITDSATLCDEFPVGLALPLLETLFRCRSKQMRQDLDADPEVWSLIGRDDLYFNFHVTQSDRQWFPRSSSKSTANISKRSEEVISATESIDNDGMTQLELLSSMLFPEDNRIREVCRLLRSSRPIFLKVPRAIEFSDHDYERKKQEKLLLLSRRTLALPIGRGMFTIGNLKLVPAEPLSLPDICLSGRVPPTNTTLALDTSECPADLKVWPEFHNGVAAGLRLPMENERGNIVSKITRTWIVYNRSSRSSRVPSHSDDNVEDAAHGLNHGHGGLLMALGMRGYLSALEMTDVFDYLTHGSITTTVGTLLGMAANLRGTCDISVSKMLCLHIPSLIPQHFSTIDVASTVQAAAVTGAGLVYEGSCHRMMTEFLLDEIGRRPSTDGNVIDREAYSLACGIALGMVNLCKGDHSREARAGLADLRIEDRLLGYIVGGPDDGEIRRRREETYRLGFPSSASSCNNERCSCVYEGESINIDVTSPGATLALGLMYMKSGNTTIASSISIPETHFLLEYVRPDFLMLRVISRALILWDDVHPTKEWIDSQVPKAILEAYSEIREQARTLPKHLKGNPPNDLEHDRQAVRLIYTHLIAGACFAIGLRYAGTGNMDAASAIFDRLFELCELRDAGSTMASALRPALPVLEMCLGCAAISLSMVLAGTGDLDALRLLKVLRWPCTDDATYGSHLAYATAIGLLFLGGGSITLGRDPKDIASLLASFYPRHPQSTSDNQYHLQALRNLYALATKRREIRAIDVDTGESVFVPVEIHFENESTMPLQLSTPCLFLNTEEKPKELRVVSRKYFPLAVAFRGNIDARPFFVKRKSGHFYHECELNSELSLLARTVDLGMKGTLESGPVLTGDQRMLKFEEHLFDIFESKRGRELFSKLSLSKFCTLALHDAFLRDNPDVVLVLLALWNSISLITAASTTLPARRDFRLVGAFYHQNLFDGTGIEKERCRLFNPTLLAFLVQEMESALENLPQTGNPRSIYYGNGPSQESDEMDVS